MESFQKISLLRDYTKAHKFFVLASILLLIVAIGAGGAGYYFYNQYQKSQQVLKNPDEAAKNDLKKMLEQVGKIIELPQGEQPNVASVVDKEKLKGQPFFAKAENGDKVIIYTQAKKAILYRPKTNKVVDITVLTVGTDNTVLATTSATTKLARVVLYNGTTINGLASNVEKTIKEKLKTVEVVVKDTAKKNTYKSTIVVVVNAAYKDQATELLKIVGGATGALPEGETKPDADIIVILGAEPPKTP